MATKKVAVKIAQDHKESVRAMQKAFKAAVVDAGLASSKCRTVCEKRVVIGPDGRAREEWVCRVVCP